MLTNISWLVISLSNIITSDAELALLLWSWRYATAIKSESVKFTEDELKSIQDIQTSYTEVTNKLGQLSIAKLRLEQQEISLEKEHDTLTETFNKIQIDEQKFLDGITDKYGQGTLNPETGLFIPIKLPNKSE